MFLIQHFIDINRLFVLIWCRFRFSYLFNLILISSHTVTGTCLFTYGLKLGELCSRDADCESGLVCDVSATSGASVCRAPMAVAKQYAEDCLTSSDCDISRYVRSVKKKNKINKIIRCQKNQN